MCGPNSACDSGRFCANGTGVTYGYPNATFECSCSDFSHCPNTTDTCNMTEVPSMCTCGDDPPCEAPSACLNLTINVGQPKCSCLNELDCLENADTCDDSISPAMCLCKNNANSSVCDPGRICLNSTELPEQPPCSCLDALDCLENADSCNSTADPPMCECSSNLPNFTACEVGRVCLNLTETPGQPPCSCLNDLQCLENANTCNMTTIPPTCECSFNGNDSAPCDPGRICLNSTETPEQPACSCLGASDCYENSNTCNSTAMPPMCGCSFNGPTFAPCEDGRKCLNITEELGQPPCSCLNASHCLVNADTCNSTTHMCECSANSPTFAPCSPGRVCIPGFGCSCETDAQCAALGDVDTCNATVDPPACECSFNLPNLDPCDPMRFCVNLTENPGQPPCSCQDESHCFETADFCNKTTSPPTCECKANSGLCDPDRVCIDASVLPGQPPCSCLNVSHCLENSDTCNDTTVPNACQCSFNVPTLAACDSGRICLNVTENPGQPSCSCISPDHCFDNADSCNSTITRDALTPSMCQCSSNVPSFAPCDPGRVCMNVTELPEQPGCSCLEASHCMDNADSCNVTAIPATCECSFNGPDSALCREGRICLNVTENPKQPGCSCLEAAHCSETSDTCNSTATPPICQCSSNAPTFDPCDVGRMCINVTEEVGQPPCSCLNPSDCFTNADTIRVT